MDDGKLAEMWKSYSDNVLEEGSNLEVAKAVFYAGAAAMFGLLVGAHSVIDTGDEEKDALAVQGLGNELRAHVFEVSEVEGHA